MTIQEFLDRKHTTSEPRVDEVFLTLVAASVLAYCCKPLLETDVAKSIGGGIGMMFGGIGSLFGLGKRKDKDEKDRDNAKDELNRLKSEIEKTKSEAEKEKLRSEIERLKNKGESNPKKENDMMQVMLDQARKSAKSEKDPAKRKKLLDSCDVIQSLTTSKDGKPLAIKDMKSRAKEIYDVDFEDLSKELDIKKLSDKEEKEIENGLEKNIKAIPEKEREKIAENGIKTANTKSKEVQTQKDKISKLQKELEDATSDDEKEKIKKDLEETQKNSFAGKLLLPAPKSNDKKEPEKDNKEEYTKKRERITDPKTGEKIRVTTYTGPRGGKFYYPKGSPRTPDHKVYIESAIATWLENKIKN